MWATKYRPTTFQSVMGQKIALRIIDGAFTNPVFPRAWLLYGSRGLGKTTIARLMATRLLGTSIDALNQNPNYFEHNASLCSHVEVLDSLLSTTEFVPVGDSRYRVVVIDEAHDLSPAAKDRLLSYLEEDIGNVVFILLTTELERLKSTIRSRCLRLHVKPVSVPTLEERLKYICESEQVTYEPMAVHEIAVRSNGFIREAITTLEQIVLASGTKECRYDDVRSHFGMDLDDVVAELMIMMVEHADDIPQFVRQYCAEYSPSIIWNSLMNLLIMSFAAKSFPGVGNDLHKRVIGDLKEDLGSIVEWCLLFGTKMGIHSVFDLVAGIGYLRQKLKYTVSAVPKTDRKHSVSRQSVRRMQNKLVQTEYPSYQDITGKLGINSAGTAST